ncbi:MAG: M64 family metallopeptidase [Pseudomonadota bacterium]
MAEFKKIVNLFSYLPFLICLLSISSVAAAEYTIEKKLNSGDDASRFVWVILAEGYRESELGKFNTDTESLINGFFFGAPWKEYKSAINIYTIFTPSLESGADHPADGKYVDTAFDATYDTYGISRLLTVNDAKALKAASQIPQFDIVFALVNDKQYGGSGGSVIVASLHEASNEIVLHEAGHIIGRLADEYTTPYPGYPAGDSEPNVTFQSQHEKIKWKSWIEADTPIPTANDIIDSIGLFKGARYLTDSIYRPKYTCKMRSLNQPYCEICREALILNIYNYVGLIEKYSPEKADIELSPGKAATLGAEMSELDATTQYDIVWEVDGEALENESNVILSLFPSMLKQGKHAVSIAIKGRTDMVRSDPLGLLNSTQTWNVTKSYCSGKLSGSIIDVNTGQALSGATVKIASLGISIQPDSSGKYEISDIGCGVYTLTAVAPGHITYNKEIAIVDAQDNDLTVTLEPQKGSFYIKGTIKGAAGSILTVELSGNNSYAANTNKNGNFIIGPVAPGEYTIKPSAAGYRFFPPLWKLRIKDNTISEIIFNARKMAGG